MSVWPDLGKVNLNELENKFLFGIFSELLDQIFGHSTKGI